MEIKITEDERNIRQAYLKNLYGDLPIPPDVIIGAVWALSFQRPGRSHVDLYLFSTKVKAREFMRKQTDVQQIDMSLQLLFIDTTELTFQMSSQP